MSDTTAIEVKSAFSPRGRLEQKSLAVEATCLPFSAHGRDD